MEPMKPMAPMKPMEPMKPFDSGSAWWPGELGEPSSSGAQNDMRYAFFPATRRLAIKGEDGKVDIYDSGDHRISGVSQQQGGASSLAFSSQDGEVRLDQVKKLG